MKKTIVIYTSQTGFTKRYAEWIAEAVDAELINLKDARKKEDDFFAEFDAIIFGGWAMAGKVVKSEWFFEKAKNWTNKKLVLFFVGASPMESPELAAALETILSEEQKKYIKLFYCPGGLDYSKMNWLSKFAMRAFSSMLKKDSDPGRQAQGEMVSHSYDISDKKYIQPIIESL